MLGHRPVQLVGRTLFTQSLGADWSNLAWCEEEATASSPIKECHTCLSRSALLVTNSIYPEDLLDLEGVGCIDTGQKDGTPASFCWTSHLEAVDLVRGNHMG